MKYNYVGKDCTFMARRFSFAFLRAVIKPSFVAVPLDSHVEKIVLRQVET